MNKIIIALGLALAAATGAFAQPEFNYDSLPGSSYGAAYHSAGENQDRPANAGIDYTATASIGDGSQSAMDTQNRARNLSY